MLGYGSSQNKMGHKYYESENEQRRRYFDRQFLSNAKLFASYNGIPLNQFLGQIKDFNSFKEVLSLSWSGDASLTNYLQGMDNSALLEFYERPLIQNILNEEEEKVTINIPIQVSQVQKKTREYFRAKIKKRPVIAYKTYVKVRGKNQIRYRDSKGRFSKIV